MAVPRAAGKEGDEWRFDGKAGRQEILDRRIGHNEMRAVETCLGYVEAQIEYARTITMAMASSSSPRS